MPGKVSGRAVTHRLELTERAAKYEADQFGAKINTVQKEIGQLKKVRHRVHNHGAVPNLSFLLQAKSDATKELEQKVELEKEQKRMRELAQEKEKLVDRTLKTIGNYVHDSVPISDNEVRNPELAV